MSGTDSRCQERTQQGHQCMDYAGHDHPHRHILPTGDTEHWNTTTATPIENREEFVDYPREVLDACPFCARRRAVEFTPSEFDHAVMQFEPLNPVAPGHMLFVPSDHVEHRNGDYYTNAHARRAMWAAHAYAIGRDEDFNLITSSGSAATQTVDHVHIHYVPRRAGDGLHLPWTGQVSS